MMREPILLQAFLVLGSFYMQQYIHAFHLQAIVI